MNNRRKSFCAFAAVLERQSVSVRPSHLPNPAKPRHGVHLNLSRHQFQPFKRVFHAANTPSYSKSFNAQIIQECAQPGASIANVALSHSLNANLVHKWICLQAQKNTALQPEFIQLPVPLAGAKPHLSSNIHVEMQHSHGTVTVNWPTENASACATFLRDLLR
ncbi:transposase [Pseudomonas poae]|uniref:transposase n=1 Tax=Pseudomonas poae TaxID=200451 RepID=UPI0030CCFE5A